MQREDSSKGKDGRFKWKRHHAKDAKCVDAQVEVFKNIISYLSEIEKEEAEKDKANHGQSELTQEDINCMMTEGNIFLFLPNFMPQLKNALRPWTFKRTHVNDFFELGDAGSWEDHDWLEWTSKVGKTQVIPACFMLERDMDPSSDDNQFLMLTQNEEERRQNSSLDLGWVFWKHMENFL